MSLIRLVNWGKRLLIFVVLLFMGLYVLAWVFEDKLGQMALDLVRKEIKTEVEVGHFQLSFIRAFPHIRGAFEDVFIQGSDLDTLLSCSTLGLNLGWSTLWSDEPALDAVVIENGFLNLHLDHSGKANYEIFTTTENEEVQPVRLQLGKAIINDLTVHVQDDKSRSEVQYHIDKGVIRGSWQDQSIDIHEELEGTLFCLKTDGDTIAHDLALSAVGPLQIDLNTNAYHLPGSDLQLGEMNTNLNGSWELSPKGTFINLDLDAGHADIEELWSLASYHIPPSHKELDPRGIADLQVTIKGVAKGKKLPEIKASLKWEDGLLKQPGGNLNDIDLAVSWDQPAGKTISSGVVNIQNLMASFDGETLQVSGSISQIDDPFVDLQASGSMPISLVQTELVSGQSGKLIFEDLTIRGKLSRNDLEASGKATLETVELSYQGDEILVPSGQIELNKDLLSARDLSVIVAGNTLHLSGDIQGVLAQFRDLKSPHTIRFDGKVKSESLNAYSLMEQFNVWQNAEPAAGKMVAQTGSGNAAFTSYQGKLSAEIGKFEWEDIHGVDFSGNVALEGKSMLISGEAQAMGGTLNLEGELAWGQKTVWDGALTCEEVEVEEAFKQCHNFGQTFLTDQQIKGALSTQLLFNAEWDAQGSFISDNLHVYATIQLDDGEIKGLDVLESFSDFIHVKDLRHVRFSTLQNYLEVVDGMVYLPKMAIRSNALTLDVTGLHGFDQKIDYGLRVDAGQVLMSKITRHDPTLKPKPTKRNGWFNLYYHLSGTADKYVYKSDRDRVKDDFMRSRFHRQRIRTALEAEFGRHLFDDDLEGDSPIAEQQDQGSSGSRLTPGVKSNKRPRTQDQKRTITKKPISVQEESEYLEDFEIEGGGGKKKKD